MTIKHILFDFDGTLVDSADCILTCYRQLLREFGVESRVKLTRSIIGPPLKETLYLLSGIQEPSVIGHMCDRFKVIYDERVIQNTHAYRLIDTLLTELGDRGNQLYIATNKRSSPTFKVVDNLNWSSVFEGVYSVDSLLDPAPNKTKLIAHIVSLHDIDLLQAIYVGDTKADALAAEANSMKFLGVSWGYSDWEQSNRTIIKEPLSLLNHV